MLIARGRAKTTPEIISPSDGRAPNVICNRVVAAVCVCISVGVRLTHTPHGSWPPTVTYVASRAWLLAAAAASAAVGGRNRLACSRITRFLSTSQPFSAAGFADEALLHSEHAARAVSVVAAASRD